jgi:ribosomal protein S18 acetylase RimI-like enzyme
VVATLTYKDEDTCVSIGDLWAAQGCGSYGMRLCYALRQKYPDATIVALTRPDNERAIELHKRIGGKPEWVLFVHRPKGKGKNKNGN